MKFLAANWKMNGELNFPDSLAGALKNVQVQYHTIICPPFPLLFKFQDFLSRDLATQKDINPSEAKSKIQLGAQNCSYLEFGPLTGEVSPLLLKELGCRYVIIGHSERRIFFNESNEDIYKKYQLLQRINLTPIICIGETEEQKLQWREVLSNQLELFKNEQNLQAIFAYEPVWSIGTGLVPDENEICERISAVKTITGNPVLYGGSVNRKNASKILNIPIVDGVLVGGASLKLEEFIGILENK